MTDLEALVVAGYVFADEYSVPAGQGRPALTSDFPWGGFVFFKDPDGNG